MYVPEIFDRRFLILVLGTFAVEQVQSVRMMTKQH